jgi:hypothetical protein
MGPERTGGYVESDRIEKSEDVEVRLKNKGYGYRISDPAVADALDHALEEKSLDEFRDKNGDILAGYTLKQRLKHFGYLPTKTNGNGTNGDLFISSRIIEKLNEKQLENLGIVKNEEGYILPAASDVRFVVESKDFIERQEKLRSERLGLQHNMWKRKRSKPVVEEEVVEEEVVEEENGSWHRRTRTRFVNWWGGARERVVESYERYRHIRDWERGETLSLAAGIVVGVAQEVTRRYWLTLLRPAFIGNQPFFIAAEQTVSAAIAYTSAFVMNELRANRRARGYYDRLSENVDFFRFADGYTAGRLATVIVRALAGQVDEELDLTPDEPEITVEPEPTEVETEPPVFEPEPPTVEPEPYVPEVTEEIDPPEVIVEPEIVIETFPEPKPDMPVTVTVIMPDSIDIKDFEIEHKDSIVVPSTVIVTVPDTVVCPGEQPSVIGEVDTEQLRSEAETIKDAVVSPEKSAPVTVTHIDTFQVQPHVPDTKDTIVTPHEQVFERTETPVPVFETAGDAAVYKVQHGDTVTGILAKHGHDPYGPALTKTIIANQDLLSSKGSAASFAVARVVEHPDWVAKNVNGTEGWRALMDAARMIHPGDELKIPLMNK